MTDTEVALLRAVCEVPDDDFPRLVYADWLDENGQGERAGYIRYQLANPHVFRSSKLDFRKSGPQPPPPYRITDQIAECIPGQGQFVHRYDDTIPFAGDFTIRRGFISEVTLTMSQFMGGPCVTSVNEFGDCPHCHGTGTIPGLARELFERWPITGVRLAGAEPDDGSNEKVQRFGWHYEGTVRDDNDNWRIDPAYLPMKLFFRIRCPKSINHQWRGLGMKQYRSRSSAHAALSAAAVAYGRGLVGLPALK